MVTRAAVITDSGSLAISGGAHMRTLFMPFGAGVAGRAGGAKAVDPEWSKILWGACTTALSQLLVAVISTKHSTSRHRANNVIYHDDHHAIISAGPTNKKTSTSNQLIGHHPFRFSSFGMKFEQHNASHTGGPMDRFLRATKALP